MLENLFFRANERRRERAMMLERKEVRAREREKTEFGEKTSYITAEYKKKLDEDNLWSINKQCTDFKHTEEFISIKKDIGHFYNYILDQKVASRKRMKK